MQLRLIENRETYPLSSKTVQCWFFISLDSAWMFSMEKEGLWDCESQTDTARDSFFLIWELLLNEMFVSGITIRVSLKSVVMNLPRGYEGKQHTRPQRHHILEHTEFSFSFSIFQTSLKIQSCMSPLSSIRWSNRKTWNNDVCVHAPFQDYRCELLTRD